MSTGKNSGIQKYLWTLDTTSRGERAYSICQAQQSVRFPQVNLGHFVLEFVISPKHSGTQIIARDSRSNRLTPEDTAYNLSVY